MFGNFVEYQQYFHLHFERFFSRNSNLPLHNLKPQRKHTLRKRKQLTKHAECAMHAAHKISSTQTGAPKRWTNTKNMRRRNKVLLGM